MVLTKASVSIHLLSWLWWIQSLQPDAGGLHSTKGVTPQIRQAHNPGSLLSSKMLMPFFFFNFLVYFKRGRGNHQWKATDHLCSVKFTLAFKSGHCTLLFPEQMHFTLSWQLRRGARALGSQVHTFSYLSAGPDAAYAKGTLLLPHSPLAPSPSKI